MVVNCVVGVGGICAENDASAGLEVNQKGLVSWSLAMGGHDLDSWGQFLVAFNQFVAERQVEVVAHVSSAPAGRLGEGKFWLLDDYRTVLEEAIAAAVIPMQVLEQAVDGWNREPHSTADFGDGE